MEFVNGCSQAVHKWAVNSFCHAVAGIPACRSVVRIPPGETRQLYGRQDARRYNRRCTYVDTMAVAV